MQHITPYFVWIFAVTYFFTLYDPHIQENCKQSRPTFWSILRITENVASRAVSYYLIHWPSFFTQIGGLNSQVQRFRPIFQDILECDLYFSIIRHRGLCFYPAWLIYEMSLSFKESTIWQILKMFELKIWPTACLHLFSTIDPILTPTTKGLRNRQNQIFLNID